MPGSSREGCRNSAVRTDGEHLYVESGAGSHDAAEHRKEGNQQDFIAARRFRMDLRQASTWCSVRWSFPTRISRHTRRATISRT
jgi:hypothetical protein